MDVIHRMKELIVEVERMVDHVILVGHRVVARVLLAYFMGLNRNDVAHVDIPLGRLYVLEPVCICLYPIPCLRARGIHREGETKKCDILLTYFFLYYSDHTV